ncbi:BZ3501_MvSof-1269-A2-R1_Chr6-1g08333 [Microbotryum saponariae]|nr:BZ3501_MvSof-1269-A2-R1_Chr6-1g08333 [Microbotryum saponariae]
MNIQGALVVVLVVPTTPPRDARSLLRDGRPFDRDDDEGTDADVDGSSILYLVFHQAVPRTGPSKPLRVLDQHLRESGGSCSLTQALHDHFNSTTNGHSHGYGHGTGNGLNGRSSRIATPLMTLLSHLLDHLALSTNSIEDEHGHHALPTTQLMGKLSIVVVEAKNLRVESGKEKPYVLLQYDRTDSVGREYGAPPPNAKPLLGVPKRGGGINRLNGHPQGLDGKGLNSVRRVGSNSNGSDPYDPTSPSARGLRS